MDMEQAAGFASEQQLEEEPSAAGKQVKRQRRQLFLIELGEFFLSSSSQASRHAGGRASDIYWTQRRGAFSFRASWVGRSVLLHLLSRTRQYGLLLYLHIWADGPGWPILSTPRVVSGECVCIHTPEWRHLGQMLIDNICFKVPGSARLILIPVCL